jgi:hypothetical protein
MGAARVFAVFLMKGKESEQEKQTPARSSFSHARDHHKCCPIRKGREENG